jgi:hypothetical protein
MRAVAVVTMSEQLRIVTVGGLAQIAESVRLGLWVTAFTIALRSSSSLRIAPAGFRAVTAFLALPVTGSLVSDGHLIAALVTLSGHGIGRLSAGRGGCDLQR